MTVVCLLSQEQLSKAAAALLTQGNIEAEKEEARHAEEKSLEKLGLKSDEMIAVLEVRKLIEDGDADAVMARLKEASGKPAVRMQFFIIGLLGTATGKIGPVVSQHKGHSLKQEIQGSL